MLSEFSFPNSKNRFYLNVLWRLCQSTWICPLNIYFQKNSVISHIHTCTHSTGQGLPKGQVILYFYLISFFWKIFPVFNLHLYFPLTKILDLEEITSVNNIWKNNCEHEQNWILRLYKTTFLSLFWNTNEISYPYILLHKGKRISKSTPFTAVRDFFYCWFPWAWIEIKMNNTSKHLLLEKQSIWLFFVYTSP